MGRDIRDITGRALQRRTKDAMGRALFHGSPHKGEKKHKQGYKAREDESLGMRTGKEAGKSQSMKDRRDESYGAWGKRGNQKINKKHGGSVSSRTKHIMDEKDEINYYEKLMRTNQADKFVFYKTKKNDPRIAMLKKNNINFVSWGREKNEKGYAWIDMDNHKSIELLMHRLLTFGHKKIALINVHQSFNYGYQRKQAYEKMLKKNNIVVNKNYYQESLTATAANGISLTKLLLDLNNPPTAIICSLDKFFIGCLQECKNQNLVVGKNISVVGYNDYDYYLSSQNLTYISHPLAQMGTDSVNILKKIENGYHPDEVSKLIKPILHEGKSDGPLKN